MKYTAFKPLNYPDGVKSMLTLGRYEGTPIIVYTNGIEQHIYNMEGERLALLSAYKGIDFLKLSFSRTWYVFAGVYLKPKKLGNIILNESPKFVITDVLVWDNECLINVPVTVRLQTYLPKVKHYPTTTAGNAEIYNIVSATNIRDIFIDA